MTLKSDTRHLSPEWPSGEDVLLWQYQKGREEWVYPSLWLTFVTTFCWEVFKDKFHVYEDPYRIFLVLFKQTKIKRKKTLFLILLSPTESYKPHQWFARLFSHFPISSVLCDCLIETNEKVNVIGSVPKTLLLNSQNCLRIPTFERPVI